MGSAIVWGVVALALGGLFIYFSREVAREVVRRQFDLKDREQAAIADTGAVELLERKTAAELAAAIVNEQAALERARLDKQAAEERIAIKAVEATTDDRIEAERRVLAAEAEGREFAAKQRAMSMTDQPTGKSDMEALIEGYKHYRDTGGSLTFDDWLGNVDVVDGRVQTR